MTAGARPLPRFRTKRLVVRMADEADAAKVLRYLEDNREHLHPFEPLKPEGYYTESFWRSQFIKSVREFYADASLRLFLFERPPGAPEEGAVIGTANFTGFARGPFQSCNLGYGLAERAQGRGLMTEALEAVIPYVFGELNLHRISANYMPHNERSGRVLERLGFEIEGLAKDYLRIEGRWRDHVLTSRVNPGWRPE